MRSMRWDEQRVESEAALPGVGDGAVVRTFDAPEAMGIHFHEVRATSALNHVPGGRSASTGRSIPSEAAPMPVSFASPVELTPISTSTPGVTSSARSSSRSTCRRCCGAELARPSWRRELVALGTNTDPYQWVESRYRFMPEILAALEEARDPRLGSDQVAAGLARHRAVRADGEAACPSRSTSPSRPSTRRPGERPSPTPRAPPRAWTRSPSSAPEASTQAS